MCGNYRQIDKTGFTARVINPLNRLYVVIRFGEEDIGHESLRISIIEGKPARLDLHHDPVTGQKNVIHRGQDELVGQRGIRRNRFRRLETFPISAAKNIHGNIQLIPAHLRPARHFVWIYIDELHHPVTIRSAGGSDKIHQRRATDAHRLG